MIEIIKQTGENLDSFWEYLQIHVAENGQNGHLLFLPLGKLSYDYISMSLHLALTA